MPANKNIFLKSIHYVCLTPLVLIGFITVIASCGGGGGGDSDSTDNNSSSTASSTSQYWEDEFEECDAMVSTDDNLPRRIRFSDDGLRLVTGLGEQDDFYYFSTTDNSDIKKIYLYFSQNDWWSQMTGNYDSETEIAATLIYDKGAEEPRTLDAQVGVRFKGDTSYRTNYT